MAKLDMSREANLFRKNMGEDAYSPIDVFAMALREPNTSTVFTDLGENISGVFCREEDSNIIIINSSMTLGRQRFSMAHELYHLTYDKKLQTIVCAKDGSLGNENERKADAFAACLLMPADGLYAMANEYKGEKKSLSITDVIKLEQYFQVSHSAMLIRLKEEGLISLNLYREFSDPIIAKAEMLDFDTSIYRSTGEEKTSGYYLQLARKLLNDGKISESKYNEMLSDAFMRNLGETEIGEDTFE